MIFGYIIIILFCISVQDVLLRSTIEPVLRESVPIRAVVVILAGSSSFFYRSMYIYVWGNRCIGPAIFVCQFLLCFVYISLMHYNETICCFMFKPCERRLCTYGGGRFICFGFYEFVDRTSPRYIIGCICSLATFCLIGCFLY